MKKGIIYSFIISLVICMIMPFSVLASTAGNEVVFTNNSSYSGTLKLFRYATEAIYPSTGGTYTYAYYFQTDPGLYGVISGRMNNSTNELFSVAVQNGISEVFYSNQISTYVYSVQLVEYNQTLPQEVIDYIKNLDENVELTTQLLDRLLLMRQYSIPVESIPWNDFVMNTIAHMPLNSTKVNYFDYPVYLFNSGEQFHRNTDLGNAGNQVIYFIFISSSYISQSTASSLFNDSDLQLLYYNMTDFSKPYFRYTIGYKLNYTNKTYGEFYLTTAVRDCVILFSKVLTIYQSIGDYIFPISTDFALITGLKNQMLNDINLIAQGTQQSQSAASDLEQGTSDLASDISSYNQIESDYNNQMNQALNNIDFSDQFSNNQNFLSGASFVKTVFNSFMQIDILRIFFIVLCIVLIAKRFI